MVHVQRLKHPPLHEVDITLPLIGVPVTFLRRFANSKIGYGGIDQLLLNQGAL
jgi:hypothetical protein